MNDKSGRISASISKVVVGSAFSITIIYSLFIVIYSWVIEDNIFNRMVDRETRYILEGYKKNGKIYKPRSGFMTLHESWKSVPNGIYERYQRNRSQVEFTLDNGKTVHINVLPLKNNIDYVLVADVDGFEVSRDYLSSIVIWLFMFSMLCCLLVALYAYKISKRITMPIERLAKAVSSDSDGNIEAGFSKAYPDNEIRSLAETIEESFLHLNAALLRESNFTKDVSHEIRTPITVLKNIIDKNKYKESVSKEEFRQISKASYKLESTTNTLLAFARNESTKKENLNLTELVENCILKHFELNHTKKGKLLSIDFHRQQDLLLMANKNLVEMLVNNLLSNIVQYASMKNVYISVCKQRLIFSNQFTAVAPQNLIRSGVKGVLSSGIGHGLSLIERICTIHSWEIKASSTQGQFVVIINF